MPEHNRGGKINTSTPSTDQFDASEKVDTTRMMLYGFNDKPVAPSDHVHAADSGRQHSSIATQP
jgi:hypothetical protein